MGVATTYTTDLVSSGFTMSTGTFVGTWSNVTDSG